MASQSPNLSAPFRLTLRLIATVGFLAISIPIARVAFTQSHWPTLFGQGFIYDQLAHTLASGRGFSQAGTRTPTILRPPLWPFVLSLPIRLCPRCGSVTVVRSIEVLVHGITAVAVAILVGVLSGSRIRMLLAALATALLPEAQPLLLGGYCEPCSAATLAVGTLLLCCGRRFFYAGIIVLSFLPLVRPNYLLLWAGVIAILWWREFRGRVRFRFIDRRQLIAATVLFYIPTGLWVMRNYFASGLFPVVAGTSNMTFFGNYNSVSGTPGPEFGTFVLPKFAYQETAGLSEVARLHYFDSKSRQFISQHWKLIPLLLATHAARSLLPASKDGAHKYFFWIFRLMLYAATAIGIWRRWIRWRSWLDLIVASSALLTVVTVVLYSGDVRYLYPLNVLLVAALAAASYGGPAKALKPASKIENTRTASAPAP